MQSSAHPLRTPLLRLRERIQRGVVLITIIAVHLMLLLWLVTRSPTVRTVPDSGRGLMLISLAAGEHAATPPNKPKPPPPTVIPPPVIMLPSLLAAPTAAQNPSPSGAGSPQAGEAGGCALSARTAEAITKDPAAMAELAALPPAYRTSADAVMLWNGNWLASEQGSVVSPVTPLLRRTVEQVVAEASPECRAAPTEGPQFMAIPEPGRTTILVIGSGTWRWSDLLATPTTCFGSASGAC
jgi:hypothetical protein